MENIFYELYSKGKEYIMQLTDRELIFFYRYFFFEREYYILYYFRCEMINSMECISEQKNYKKIYIALKNEIAKRNLLKNKNLKKLLEKEFYQE